MLSLSYRRWYKTKNKIFQIDQVSRSDETGEETSTDEGGFVFSATASINMQTIAYTLRFYECLSLTSERDDIQDIIISS